MLEGKVGRGTIKFNYRLCCYCADVNECEDGRNGGCAQTCTNLVGNFECACSDGYTLSEDGLDCLGNICICRS